MTKSQADGDSEEHMQGPSYGERPRPQWIVRPNEDLGKLSKHLFTDARYGWLIADLNQGSTTELKEGTKRVVKLCVGQKITLPVWQDIVAFHKQHKNVDTSDLITVTVSEKVDSEQPSWGKEPWRK